MNRKLFITIHLYLAAFLTPILLMIALSGGLYLLNVKGEYQSEEIYRGDISEFDFAAENRKQQVEDFLKANKIDFDFEYTRGGKESFMTRPTSKENLVFKKSGDEFTVTKRSPDFVKTLVELHKGHGPLIFKDFQKITALGLILILLTGFYLGLTSPSLKSKTLIISGAGAAIFFVLVLI